MPDPAPFPSFPDDLVALQGDAILALLREDTALRDFFNAGIEDIESERIFFGDNSGLAANFLGVAPGPMSEDRTGNDGYGTLTMGWDLFVLTAFSERMGTQRWLRARVVSRIKELLWQNDGTLYDPEGNALTEALVKFERLDFAGRLRGSNLIVTPLRVTHTADLDQRTRRFIR